jgi:hypothetical protein
MQASDLISNLKTIASQSLFNPWVAFLVVIPAFFGLGLWFMGTVFAIVVALGDPQLGWKRWLWVTAMVLLGPLAAIPFAMAHPQAKYARSVLLKGTALLLPALLFYSWQLISF